MEISTSSVLHLTILTFSFLFHLCNSTDTISSTQFISDSKNETLISSNGNFKLGFFNPKNSQNRYLGIWFNKVPQLTVVWVANRDAPIKNRNGVFKITGDGNAAVFSGAGKTETPLWSTNLTVGLAVNSTAKLLSSGNLVLNTMNGSGRILWQSFDYPTDTLLPEMKLGLDRRMGLNRVLSSWKSDSDPGSGDFTFGIDTRGSPQFLLYNKSAPYWRSGPAMGRTLSGIPAPVIDISGNYSYVFTNNNGEIYLSFTVPDASIFTIIVLEPLGRWAGQTWFSGNQRWKKYWVVPYDSCDEYSRCGPSAICNSNIPIQCACLPGFEPQSSQDRYSSCVEKKKPLNTCGKGNGEGFKKISEVKVPDAKNASFIPSLSLQECQVECLKSCDCNGYASANVGEGGVNGCYLWHGVLDDVRVFGQDGQDFYVRVDKAVLGMSADVEKKVQGFGGIKRTLTVIILPVVLGVILFIACLCYFRRKYNKKEGLKDKQKYQEMVLQDLPANMNSPSANTHEESTDIELKFFDLNIVIAATHNFSPTKKLGEGGYGPVYKGELPNGQEIAVKRLSKNSGQGVIEFKNEVLLIAKLQHRNLVRLLGCCIENEEKMLIYEYMPNKSLDYYIFDETRKSMLNWKTRHEIIVGIARGMLYLHQDSRLRIIHRDLKASNILLDQELDPKISDFGTARIVGGNQNEANTNRVVGTYGYMSPEYALSGLFSLKSDVFSFGVLLLEIISGTKNMGSFHVDPSSNPSSNLIRHAWQLWSEGRALEIVDASLGDSCLTDEVLRCIQVGLLCVQDNAAKRPIMSSVVFMLSNEATLPSPEQPMFVIERNQKNTNSSTTKSSASVDEMTITILEAR